MSYFVFIKPVDCCGGGTKEFDILNDAVNCAITEGDPSGEVYVVEGKRIAAIRENVVITDEITEG